MNVGFGLQTLRRATKIGSKKIQRKKEVRRFEYLKNFQFKIISPFNHLTFIAK